MDRIRLMEEIVAFRSGQISRREFIHQAATALGSLGAASLLATACAASPGETTPVVVGTVVAETAASDGRVITESVRFEAATGTEESGTLARPAGDGPHPAVVVIQEWWGLNAHIRDVTRRIAAEGYVALAPDLYRGVVVSEPDEARKLAMALDRAAAVAQIHAAIDFLLAQPFVAGQQVAVTGFCMGGGLALQSAVGEPRVALVMPFYGSPLRPAEAGNVSAALLGFFGGRDSISLASVQAMADAITAAGGQAEIVVYDEAGHAFFNDTRASYDSEAAADAWSRLLSALKEHLAA